jgi:hypothetical protein
MISGPRKGKATAELAADLRLNAPRSEENEQVMPRGGWRDLIMPGTRRKAF